MGEVCFSDVGTSFLSGGVPHGGASVLMGGGFEKNLRMGRVPPMPPPLPLWETLGCGIKMSAKTNLF